MQIHFFMKFETLMDFFSLENMVSKLHHNINDVVNHIPVRAAYPYIYRYCLVNAYFGMELFILGSFSESLP